MSQDSEYEEWVRLANDPSQPEEVRQQCRARMEAYVHEKIRAAFQLATRQAAARQ
jgi:hypothetical protein